MARDEDSARSEPTWLARPQLGRLLAALVGRGYAVLAPVVREQALAFAEIERVEDLPIGWRDEQEPGRYRLAQTGGTRCFDVVHGPGGLKPHVFAPREPMLRVEMEPERPFRAALLSPPRRPLAVIGVRSCDLAALTVQDRVFLGDRFRDPWYGARREDLFLVAVGCTRAVATCFCASMGTGPAPAASYDIALTELDADAGGFVVRAGSDAGRAVLAALALPAASADALAAETSAYAACAGSMTRSLPRDRVRDLLYANLEHPRWDEVAERCLSCGNCTMVCPTCFCHAVRDEPTVDLRESVRVREWDSCFDVQHAQIHGLNFRPHTRERYRQWLVHKLATWVDQFDTSGCVGCGRCITWCPVGIDLTEEVAAIDATSRAETPS